MGIPITGTFTRGANSAGAFAINTADNLMIPMQIVADISARDDLATYLRMAYMLVYVVSTGETYRLASNLTTWNLDSGDYILTTAKGAANGVAPLDANSKIPNQYLSQLVLSQVFAVADLTEMFALTAYEGNLIIVADASADPLIVSGSAVYVKLDDVAPTTTLANFLIVEFGTSVTSVNGDTGIVSVDFSSMIAETGSSAAFEAAVTANTTVSTNAADILTNAGAITSLGSTKANLTDILTRTNVDVYTPSTDYHPSTKKYVDDAVSGLSADPAGSTTEVQFNLAGAFAGDASFTFASSILTVPSLILSAALTQDDALDEILVRAGDGSIQYRDATSITNNAAAFWKTSGTTSLVAATTIEGAYNLTIRPTGDDAEAFYGKGPSEYSWGPPATSYSDVGLHLTKSTSTLKTDDEFIITAYSSTDLPGFSSEIRMNFSEVSITNPVGLTRIQGGSAKVDVGYNGDIVILVTRGVDGKTYTYNTNQAVSTLAFGYNYVTETLVDGKIEAAALDIASSSTLTLSSANKIKLTGYGSGSKSTSTGSLLLVNTSGELCDILTTYVTDQFLQTTATGQIKASPLRMSDLGYAIIGDTGSSSMTPTIELQGLPGDNLSLTIIPQGTGTVKVPTGYEANISADEDLINKKYADLTYQPIATGTPDGTKFLKDDGSWAVPAGGGTIVGATGAVDNSILRADGVGGSTVQNSSLFIDDTANLTLGSASLAGFTRTLNIDSSETAAHFVVNTKGIGEFEYTADSVSIAKFNSYGNLLLRKSSAIETSTDFLTIKMDNVTDDVMFINGANSQRLLVRLNTSAVSIRPNNSNSTMSIYGNGTGSLLLGSAGGKTRIYDGVFLSTTEKQEIKTIEITLGASQIRLLKTTPIDLGIPLPGAGKYIQILGASANYTWNSTFALTGGGTVDNIQLSQGSEVIFATHQTGGASMITTAGNKIRYFQQADAVALTAPDTAMNTAIDINSLSDYTGGGTGTIDIFVQYVIIDTN